MYPFFASSSSLFSCDFSSLSLSFAGAVRVASSSSPQPAAPSNIPLHEVADLAHAVVVFSVIALGASSAATNVPDNVPDKPYCL